MKALVKDVDSVAQLSPLEVASYLRATGWEATENHPGKYSVWTDNTDSEAVLPLTTDYEDYALRMGDILNVLAKAEHRSPLAVLSDLLITSADVLRVRLSDHDLADGSMPIEDHARTAQKVRDLMLAAACSAIERKSIWSKRKPDKAIAYLRNVRIGQTERGSYVLTVLSKVTPLLQSDMPNLFGETEEPYERRVTTELAGALAAINQASEAAAATGKFDSFESAVREGVSANLCEAIAGLSTDEENNRAIDFTFSWSRSRPARKDQISQVVIAHDRVQFIQEAARLLRARSPIEGFDVEGPVIKLERTESAGPGMVTVYAMVEDTPRRVRIELAEEEYNLAIQAHQGGLDVICSGRLAPEGRGYVMKYPNHFSVKAETP